MNAQDTDGATALHHAAAASQLEILRDILLPKGGDRSIKAANMGTPLQVAERRVRTKNAISGKEMRRRREVSCHLKTTSIHQASRDGDTVRVKYLVEVKGEDVNVANTYGCTSMHYAAMGGHVALAKYLYEHGASIRVKNRLGQTPLDVARTDEVLDAMEEKQQERERLRTMRRKRAEAKRQRFEKSDAKDREAWVSVRGTSAAVDVARRLRRRAEVRKTPIKARSQRKGIFAKPPRPSRLMHVRGKDETTPQRSRAAARARARTRSNANSRAGSKAKRRVPYVMGVPDPTTKLFETYVRGHFGSDVGETLH